MGPVKTVLITGASGFVGSSAVRAARQRGLRVIALYRSLPLANWESDGGITAVKLDLAARDAAEQLAEVLPQADAVVHAAAHLGDDPVQHERLSLGGTRALLDALERHPARLVLVSSIVVYDPMALEAGGALDETCPLGNVEGARDPYSHAKLAQEQMVRERLKSAWLIRPGAVWGPGRTWHALLGFWASKLFVRIGSSGELPMVHVEPLGHMLVQAALTDPVGISAVNALDDDRPDRARFMAAHRRLTGWPKLVLPVPYGLWFRLVRLLRPVSGKLPGLFREPVVRARLMPLQYDNTLLRELLGGADRAPFEEMLKDSVEGAR